jgi:predicted phosphohydrolase
VSLLLEASADDHVEVIKMLRRPDMKVRWEPLHKACRTGNTKAVLVLLKNGHSLQETVVCPTCRWVEDGKRSDHFDGSNSTRIITRPFKRFRRAQYVGWVGGGGVDGK